MNLAVDVFAKFKFFLFLRYFCHGHLFASIVKFADLSCHSGGASFEVCIHCCSPWSDSVPSFHCVEVANSASGYELPRWLLHCFNTVVSTIVYSLF